MKYTICTGKTTGIIKRIKVKQPNENLTKTTEKVCNNLWGAGMWDVESISPCGMGVRIIYAPTKAYWAANKTKYHYTAHYRSTGRNNTYVAGVTLYTPISGRCAKVINRKHGTRIPESEGEQSGWFGVEDDSNVCPDGRTKVSITAKVGSKSRRVYGSTLTVENPPENLEWVDYLIEAVVAKVAKKHPKYEPEFLWHNNSYNDYNNSFDCADSDRSLNEYESYQRGRRTYWKKA